MPNIVRFDCFAADLESRQLQKRGIRIKLRNQSFQVLASLLENPGRVVTREDLRRRLWHDEVFVDFDNNLNIAIARLREALGDSADHPRFIETLPKRGYRFIGNISPSPSEAGEEPVHRPRLVVLPFITFSADPSQSFLGDVITEEIITELASLATEQLAVLARTTTMHYKGSHKDVARISRELNVDYLIEGAVRPVGDRIAINVQLIQAADQAHLFARKYDVAVGKIFYVQNEIAGAIAAQIPAIADRVCAGVKGSSKVTRKPAGDLAAYGEYIQGRHHMAKATAEGFVKARQHFETAIARDPEFASAYDALAELYWYFGYVGFMRPKEAFSAGIVHALRTLEIDNTRAETHALLGQFHKTIEYNWPEVRREMALALQLDPDSPTVRMRYALSELMPHGRVEEAVAELERALEFDPLSLFVRFWLGIMLLFCHRYEQALEQARKLLDLDSTYFPAYFIIAVSYRYKNMAAEAVAAQRKAVELSGDAAAMLGWLGLTLAANGQLCEARSVLQRLYEKAAVGYVPPSSFAWIHLGLKEIDTAFEWLDRAVEECDQLIMPLKSYAFLDPIRSDPRFTSLLRKMNLDT